MKAWMRKLYVEFRHDKNDRHCIRYGDKKSVNVSISCKIKKYMHSSANTATVQIKNLPYSEIVQLLLDDYKYITIYCGYHESKRMINVFSGYVVYISNEFNDHRTTTAHILCQTFFFRDMAKTVQLTTKSGINMEAALKELFAHADIESKHFHISKELGKQMLNRVQVFNGSLGDVLESMSREIPGMTFTADEDILSLDNNEIPSKSIPLRNDQINIAGGFPALDTDGLTLRVLPTLPLKCGDIIKIDKSIVDTHIASISKFRSGQWPALRQDENGEYQIKSMDYDLSNRETAFYITLQCLSLTFAKMLKGGL